MTIKKNPSGNVYSTIEADLYTMIEKGYIKIPNLENPKHFPHFFNLKYLPDFLFTDTTTNEPVYLEVKPRFVTVSDMQQLIKYYIHLQEEGKGKANSLSFVRG